MFNTLVLQHQHGVAIQTEQTVLYHIYIRMLYITVAYLKILRWYGVQQPEIMMTTENGDIVEVKLTKYF